MARPRQHSQDSILAAASQAYSDEGVATTTAQVAKAAGVSNGTLFNYYPTKQGLVDGLYLWLKEDLCAAIGVIDPALPLRSQLQLIWDRWLHWARRHPERHVCVNLVYHSRLVSNDAHADSQRFFVEPARVLTEAESSGLFATMPREYLADLMVRQLDQAATAGLDLPAQALAFDMMWNGLTR